MRTTNSALGWTPALVSYETLHKSRCSATNRQLSRTRYSVRALKLNPLGIDKRKKSIQSIPRLCSEARMFLRSKLGRECS